MKALLRPAAVLLALLTLLTGLLYPLAVTGLAQVIFPVQANGSLILGGADGRVLGSALIGQSFIDPRYFWGRPSATTSFPYNAAASAGSNLGPSNPALVEAVQARVTALRTADPGNSLPVPADLVTASGSGLDPDISVAAALYQAPRVARVRGLDVGVMRQLIARHTEGRQLGPLRVGEPRVNVLKLNLALDGVEWTNDQIDERPMTNDRHLGAYPNTPQPAILSLSKGGWRLRKAAPFDELRMLSRLFG